MVEFISLIHLVQNPKDFDGKIVRVVGFASIKFESRALYIAEEGYRNAVTKNAVWLQFEVNDENIKLHEKYVLVEGLFDAGSFGHLKMFSGTIKEIARLELWSDPKKLPK